MAHKMVVGTTEPQDIQVLNEGAAIVGTGFNVAIVFRTSPGGTPVAAWLNQATGTVRVTGTGSMRIGMHYYRIALTDSGGKVGYVPNLDPADIWEVEAV